MRRPNYVDVRWDHGAANAAIGACMRAADELEHAMADCNRALTQAREHWQGNRMEQFLQERQALDSHGRSLANDCRAAAHAIGAASQQAHAEQQRREQERADYERWEREERERREREERERRARERQQQAA
ncbi:hypothetical protein [Candidatus Viridilinea mediisalina]|uniref:Uncharacterized protein n=1 Tax=Candidatus Viridilinea mediisalina TaxID=2024553 RepID=A0A2A6RKI8_9CHLR|nr:hypothetical protein [Candidatus Viridilinea mediisalina]PDW03431.1 hypothetical protein CJ255_08865 [Candidatus Viridilinea mediisalina]